VAVVDGGLDESDGGVAEEGTAEEYRTEDVEDEGGGNLSAYNTTR